MTAGPEGVLLTVSGNVDPDVPAAVAAGRRPRADYAEMAEVFGADIIDYTSAARASGRFGRFLRRLAGDDVLLAVACFRRRRQYRTVFTDGEQVGIPYAALCWLARRRPRHVMIGHVLSPRKKALLHRLLRLQHRVDVVVVYATAQRTFAIEALGYRPDQVVLTPFMVDTDFWQDDPTSAVGGVGRPMICSVGLERRDYPTLMDAVRGLDLDVVVAAASPWSKRTSTADGVEIPPNVVVRSFDQFDLRALYRRAAFVVVPLEETDFQAGITTILEAMSMGRAVVCSRTAGQTDTVVDGVNGVEVTPGRADELRDAIVRLVDDPGEAERLGRAGRAWAVEHAAVTTYADRLRSTLDH
ncbi:MAG: glycosyltransferase family 4 protein [Ilumatobacteraceae bacterium]